MELRGWDQPDASLVANAQKLIDLTAAQAQEVDPDLRLQKMEEMQLFALDELVPGINLPVPGHSWVVYNSRVGNFPEDDVLLGGVAEPDARHVDQEELGNPREGVGWAVRAYLAPRGVLPSMQAYIARRLISRPVHVVRDVACCCSGCSSCGPATRP